MSFAKRLEDLKDRSARGRIEAFLKEGEMAELKVRSDGEEVVFGIPGGLDVRMSLDEVEEFVKELDQVMDEATRCSEHRLAEKVRDLTPHVFSKDEIE
jgi:hypothetical protein